MVQPSWNSPIYINVTKPRLEEQNNLVPICKMIISTHNCYTIREHDQDGGSMIKIYTHPISSFWVRNLLKEKKEGMTYWKAITLLIWLFQLSNSIDIDLHHGYRHYSLAYYSLQSYHSTCLKLSNWVIPSSSKLQPLYTSSIYSNWKTDTGWNIEWPYFCTVIRVTVWMSLYAFLCFFMSGNTILKECQSFDQEQ